MPEAQKTSVVPSRELLDEIVRRIVEAVHPKKIVLFGSAARGDMGPDSDVDLLVIMPDGTHRRNTELQIRRVLWGVGVAKDVVVVTEDDVARYRHEHSLVIKPAMDEGRAIYANGE